jgi:hypothetical protein
MVQKKRVVLATVFGSITGLVCYLGGRLGLGDQIGTMMFVYIMVNRTLIGLVIGISVLKLHWAAHGAIIGLLVGVPFTFGCLLEEGNIETAIAAFVLSAVYGFVIEFFTSVVFGARAGSAKLQTG